MSIHAADRESVEWRPIRADIERKTFAGEGATSALHRTHPAHELLPHAHHYEQIVYMLEGAADFQVGDEVHRLAPAGLLVVPPSVVHYIEVVGKEVALELDVFTPNALTMAGDAPPKAVVLIRTCHDRTQ